MEKLVLSGQNISKSYGQLEVLKKISLQVKKGEVISITGDSGAGKTTLLQILGTLDTSSQGKIIINGVDIKDLREKALATFRNREIGFVFQFHHLLPEFTAIENICIPAYIAKKNKKETQQKARDFLSLLGLKDRANHKPSRLSGGEQQRVAVARALINMPSIIFADEPSGNLDSKSAETLHQLFFELRDRLRQTFVLVTHNQQLAEMSDRQLVMKDGSFCQ